MFYWNLPPVDLSIWESGSGMAISHRELLVPSGKTVQAMGIQKDVWAKFRKYRPSLGEVETGQMVGRGQERCGVGMGMGRDEPRGGRGLLRKRARKLTPA